MNAKYQVYKDAAGKFRFRLRAENSKIVAVSEAYDQHAGCLNGVKSVQTNCGAQIEDLTTEGARITNPKYQVFYDKACGFRFRLNAKNGEIIAQSEGYKSKESCMNGIEAVKASCGTQIEDMTVTQAQSSEKTIDETVMAPSVAPVDAVTETKMEKKGIMIDLDALPESVTKGDIMFFKGNLTEDGKGIANARVSIREHDRSFVFDEVLAEGYTRQDGSFEISFKARKVDMLDDSGEFYAQYDQNKDPKHVRSKVQSVVIN